MTITFFGFQGLQAALPQEQRKIATGGGQAVSAGGRVRGGALRCFFFGMVLATALVLSPKAFCMDRFDIVTTEELAGMLADRSAGNGDFVLVNVLDKAIFENGHIPGSINIPWTTVDRDLGLLGEDKDRLVVTYCMGYR